MTSAVWQAAAGAPGRPVAGVSRPALDGPAARCEQPEDVDRARAGPDAAQAVAHRVAGDAPGDARRLERRAPERELRGERRGVRAAGPVRGAVGVTLARGSR